MNLKSVHNIYFIGIGGIGMSALAKYFLAVGKKVGGYDIKPSLSTDSLIELGVSIQFEANSSMIDEIFSDPLNTLIVFTPAIVAMLAQEKRMAPERSFQTRIQTAMASAMETKWRAAPMKRH